MIFTGGAKGLPAEYSPVADGVDAGAKMDFQIIGVPLELGCGTVGTAGACGVLGPRISGLPLFSAGGNTCRYTAVTVAPSPRRRGTDGVYNLADVAGVCRELARTVSAALEKKRFPLVIGGDHSVGLGSIAGAAGHYSPQELAVVWVDAHTDINTEKTTPSGNVHGMPLAAALGLCGAELTAVGPPGAKLRPENLFILCSRSIDPPEREIIAAQGVRVIEMPELRRRGTGAALAEICRSMAGKAVHLSFDTDVLDPDCFTATGLNVPDGIFPAEAARILCELIRGCRVVSMDCVEYNPSMDPQKKDLRTLLSILEPALETVAAVRREAPGNRSD